MLFPAGFLPNAPRLETSKALLLIDLQNDFLQQDGKLFVENAREFLPKLPSLVAKFRDHGDVFWIHTEFQQPQPTISSESESYVVVLKEFLNATEGNGIHGWQPGEQSHRRIKHAVQNLGRDNPEAFLAQRLKADLPRCCLPDTSGCASPDIIASHIDRQRDLIIAKTDYSAFQTRSLLPSMRMRFITKLYLCGSLSNVSVYATALDAVRHGLEVTIIEDCVGYLDTECHQEAMRLMADAMGVNGTDYQELMDDLSGLLGDVVTPSTFQSTVGTRSVDGGDNPEDYTMRVKTKRWMGDTDDDSQSAAEHCGADEVDLPEPNLAKRRSLRKKSGLSASSGGKGKENKTTSIHNAPQKRASDEIAGENTAKTVAESPPSAKTSRVRMRRSRLPREPGSASGQPASPATPSKEAAVLEEQDKRTTSEPTLGIIEVDSDPDRSTLEEMSSLVDKAKAFGRTLRSSKQSRHSSTKTLGPGDFIGERDSRIIYDFLPPTAGSSNEAFTRLRNDGDTGEVRWQKMYHRSGEVPRLVAVQGEVASDGSIPIYRHPADESPTLLPFSPTVQSIRQEVEKAIGHPVNHVLIQLYRNGEDNISEHSDKTIDVVRDSFIVNVSLGAMRTITLRTKKSAAPSQVSHQQRRASAPASTRYANGDEKRTAQRIPLPHNSLFILGQDTNQIWLHAIRADRRPASEKKEEELGFNGERISLTFRHIGTFINPKASTIWGQGATSKTEQGARAILKGQEAEKEGEMLIRAFGRENHQSYEFDWQTQYGAGFNVVNFATREDASVNR